MDLSMETLLSFSDAVKRLPGKSHISTLHRWRLHGVCGVKLETALIGRRRFTSVEAIQRFSDTVTAAADGAAACAPTSSKRDAQTSRELDRIGI